jgi:hypothetical protein
MSIVSELDCLVRVRDTLLEIHQISEAVEANIQADGTVRQTIGLVRMSIVSQVNCFA